MQHIPSQPPPGDRSLANYLLRGLNALPGVYPLLAFIFCARVHVIGWSMSPTLLPNEYALFDTLAYRLRPPQRDDIVLVRDPRTPTRTLIKRLAGVPGDAVRVGEDGCWINGALRTAPEDAPAAPTPFAADSLPPDHYFLLGDAPPFSTDSREFGAVAGSLIIARGWRVFWPPQRSRDLQS